MIFIYLCISIKFIVDMHKIILHIFFECVSFRKNSFQKSFISQNFLCHFAKVHFAKISFQKSFISQNFNK